jgi:hypothetical protein
MGRVGTLDSSIQDKLRGTLYTHGAKSRAPANGHHQIGNKSTLVDTTADRDPKENEEAVV